MEDDLEIKQGAERLVQTCIVLNIRYIQIWSSLNSLIDKLVLSVYVACCFKLHVLMQVWGLHISIGDYFSL